MKKFFNFNEMITPTIIKVLLWVGLGISVVYGLVVMFMGFVSGEGIITLAGLFALVVGPILVRVYCELLIIMFKIHDTLNDIKNN